MIEVQLVVNGTPETVRTRADRRLVDTLRDDFGLDDTRVSCEDGVCGVCTVVIDGRLASACLTLTVQADRTEVWTAAGLADRSTLTELRSALEAEGGIQCGFCTNGQFVTAAALVDSGIANEHERGDDRDHEGVRGAADPASGAAPTSAADPAAGADPASAADAADAARAADVPAVIDSVEHMHGTLCRCTGYYGVLRAVERARR